MLTLHTLRRERKAEILHCAEIHGCRNVHVFGSVATGENRPDSDIDFLVDLDRGRGLLDLADYSRVSMIFGGDMGPWKNLKTFINNLGKGFFAGPVPLRPPSPQRPRRSR